MLQFSMCVNLLKIKVIQKILIFICLAIVIIECSKNKKNSRFYGIERPTINRFTKTSCIAADNVLRAKHKSCFLRPDSGPCRADVISWYFDVRQRKCYRFFWGGCQGNGNRFETKKECWNYCFLDEATEKLKIPYFCSMAFDYGTCFGHYNRWGWDKLEKTCKRRIYSGCGGNQNNFETRAECLATCVRGPNNTLSRSYQYTTCIPFRIPELQ